MYSAELVYVAPYLMSAQKRREVSAANSAASSRKNSVVDASAAPSAAPSRAASRAASPAPKERKTKEQAQFDVLSKGFGSGMRPNLAL